MFVENQISAFLGKLLENKQMSDILRVLLGKGNFPFCSNVPDKNSNWHIKWRKIEPFCELLTGVIKYLRDNEDKES